MKEKDIIIQAVDTLIQTVEALGEQKKNTKEILGICVAFVHKDGYMAKFNVSNVYSGMILQNAMMGIMEKIEERIG